MFLYCALLNEYIDGCQAIWEVIKFIFQTLEISFLLITSDNKSYLISTWGKKPPHLANLERTGISSPQKSYHHIDLRVIFFQCLLYLFALSSGYWREVSQGSTPVTLPSDQGDTIQIWLRVEGISARRYNPSLSSFLSASQDKLVPQLAPQKGMSQLERNSPQNLEYIDTFSDIFSHLTLWVSRTNRNWLDYKTLFTPSCMAHCVF